jgi:hypothetical protein
MMNGKGISDVMFKHCTLNFNNKNTSSTREKNDRDMGAMIPQERGDKRC